MRLKGFNIHYLHDLRKKVKKGSLIIFDEADQFMFK